MKHYQIIILLFLLIGCKTDKTSTKIKETSTITSSEEFVIIEQDYKKALKIANKSDKLIFVDFYTTWCAPCKQLDKLVFKNDSIQQILKKDFILLKYDAENDTIFHLSKKHHISSYPTGLILNKNGFVLNRKYGFLGNDFKTLSENLMTFANEGSNLNKNNITIKGYSNKINASNYPKFYVDFVNRTNTKINLTDLNKYWNSNPKILSEEYFSTLIYFAREASNQVANKALKSRDEYLNLYGKTDVNILMYFLTSGRFKEAIAEKSEFKFNEAITFANKALDKKSVNVIINNSKKDLLKAQNKWAEVLEINQKLKDDGKLDNGYANHFSWEIYKKCDDKEVIKKCLQWMKEVTDKEPKYDYLDTYARLMYKSGNIEQTKKIAQLAIEAGKKEGRETKNLKKLLNAL
jgi:thiol-disulfide isomerase/thioredoxin